MPYKYCQHVRENGTFCASGAVKGRSYCYFHLRTRARRLAMAQAQSQQKAWRPELPPLEDMHAVQVALMQVLDALTAEAIDPHRAGLILYGLQQAATNLHHYHDWLQPSRFEFHAREGDDIVDRYPGLEAEFRLPKRIDLDALPEELFPPPRTVPKSMTTDAWLIAVHNALGDSSDASGAEAQAAVAPSMDGTQPALVPADNENLPEHASPDLTMAKKSPQTVKPERRRLERLLPPHRAGRMPADGE